MRPCAGDIVPFSPGKSIPGPDWRNLVFCISACPKVVMHGLWMLKVPANPAIRAAVRLLLLAALLLGTLAVTLGIDFGSEGAGDRSVCSLSIEHCAELTPPT